MCREWSHKFLCLFALPFQSPVFQRNSTWNVWDNRGKYQKTKKNRTIPSNITRVSKRPEERREELKRKVRPANIPNATRTAEREFPKQNSISNTQRENQTVDIPEETPKALKRDLHIENKEDITIEKTNDILKQINEYLDQEKTKLKKGNDITW